MSDGATINSREYWERRFRENWGERHGAEQTRFFAELLTGHLPEWFVSNARRHRLSLCDWGCAEGEAVFCLGQMFNPYLLRVEDKAYLDGLAEARAGD